MKHFQIDLTKAEEAVGQRLGDALQTLLSPADLEQTLEMPSLAGQGPVGGTTLSPAGQGPVTSQALPPSRSELVEFVRWIIEGSGPRAQRELAGGKVYGLRAIELSAFALYQRLMEAGEI